jgi:5,10-methylenetetrahydromethanopterin reductase
MKQELGITFRSEAQTPLLIEEVASRHGRGIDMLGVYDDLGDFSPVVPLMFAARALPRDANTRVGPVGFAVPKYRSMVDIVGHMTTLHAMRPNNVFLGLVPGAWMDELGLASASVEKMKEAIESARYLFHKNKEGYEGKYFPIKRGFALGYETPKDIPILLGAYGPKLTALAGEMADEVKVGGSANPALVPIIRDRIAIGARKGGRNVGDIKIAFGAVSMVDSDGKKALDAARKKAVVYINVIGDKDPTVVRDYPEEIKEIKNAMSTNDVNRAIRFLPDALTKRFTLAGTPQDVIKQSEDLFNAGVSRIEFGTPHGVNDEMTGVNLLVEKVFPYFRKK